MMSLMLGFLYFLCFSTSTNADSTSLDQILNHVGGKNDVVSFKDIDNIFTGLNFKNCSKEESSKCNFCFTAADLYAHKNLNVAANLTNKQFYNILQDVLYLLVQDHNSSVGCKNKTAAAFKTIDVFENFKNKYGSKNNNLEGEKSLEKILHNLEEAFGESFFTNKECFSAHDIIESANASEESITKEQFNDVTAYLILNLLQKKCIKEEHEENELPHDHEFVEDLFKTYGNTTHMSHENFESLVKALKLGGESEEGGHDGHDHKRKRRSLLKQRKRRSEDDHDHDDEHKHEKGVKKCFTAENLLTIFKVPEDSYIDINKFEKMSPALIQQVQSNACKHEDKEKEKSKPWQAWVGSMVAILIISLASLIGVVATPFTKKKWFPYAIMFLIALAVAVLIGDAIIHLFPHSLGLHAHDEGGHDDEDGNPQFKSDSFLWKSMCFLLGVYLFLTFEMFMHGFGGGHSHAHGEESKPQDNMENIKGVYTRRRSSLQQTQSKGTLRMTEDLAKNKKIDDVRRGSLVMNASGMYEYQEKPLPNELDTTKDIVYYNPSIENIVVSPSSDKLVESPSENSITNNGKGLSLKEFKSVAWLVLIGDGIHNFLDGVAIGVAFSEHWPSGLHGGISTSIAIFCHELPHELGDFAVLIASGLSIRQALLMNYLSSMLSFLGGIVGCAIGSQWDATFWIFAATAGLFIYIALADMLPEALHSENLKSNPWKSILMLQCGLLLGFAIMFVLGAWEEDIKTAFV